jgi:hypothetical protein
MAAAPGSYLFSGEAAVAGAGPALLGEAGGAAANVLEDEAAAAAAAAAFEGDAAASSLGFVQASMFVSILPFSSNNSLLEISGLPVK